METIKYYIYWFYQIDKPENKYVGHCETFDDRVYIHIHSDYFNRRKRNRKNYKHVRENGGWNNFKFEIVSEHICTKDEIRKIEGDLIKECGTLNMAIAGRTSKEWRQTKFNCECGSIVCNSSKNKHNQSRKHKEYVKNM